MHLSRFQCVLNSINQKVTRLNTKLLAYPTFVVNGKYWVDSKRAGGEERLFQVLDYLIQKEAQ